MKRMIVEILALLMLVSCPAALAQDDPLAGIVMENGVISGTVTARFGSEWTALKIDCPVPESPYPAEILTVGKGRVSKRQMQAALQAAGQCADGQFLAKPGFARYTGDWRAPADADISKEDAAARATGIGLAYFDALGVEVERTPRGVYRPYDFEDTMDRQAVIYTHRYSDTTAFMEAARSLWKRAHKYDPGQSAYTRVDFNLALDGMRLWEVPSYPANYADEPDAWLCTPVDAHVIVSDSGVLVEASCDLFAIEFRRPLAGDPAYAAYADALQSKWGPLFPATDWRDALTTVLTRHAPAAGLHTSVEDQPYQNQNMTQPVTAYGYDCVITGVKPYLTTMSESEWVPVWCIESMSEYPDGFRY